MKKKTKKKLTSCDDDLLRAGWIKIEPKSISDHYNLGWHSEDPKQHELYRTIMNDLAEGIEIPARVTQRKLAEALGFMSHQECRRIDEKEALRMEVILAASKDMKLQFCNR